MAPTLANLAAASAASTVLTRYSMVELDAC